MPESMTREAIMNRRTLRMAVCAIIAFLSWSIDASLLTARAADKLRVGKSIGAAFTYVPLDVGVSQGIFQKQGLDIEIYNFGGAARQTQAMTAGSVDIGLGSSTAMALIVKGAPMLAVGVIANSVANIGILVPADSPIETLSGLKGKKIGITTPGSLTDWMLRELNRSQGWGSDGARAVAIGSSRAGNIAALKTASIDALIDDYSTVFDQRDAKDLRLLAKASTFSRDFVREVIFATNIAINDRPDVIRRFVKGWLESIAFMKSHRAETSIIGGRVQSISSENYDKMYDAAISMFSDNGRFDPVKLEVLRTSFVELGILPTAPDMSKLYTEDFLPK
jgi:ABC-type nitrate/sulfonate/bicarbonate transport system substrate-binding protein